jgi:hypothetical protein
MSGLPIQGPRPLAATAATLRHLGERGQKPNLDRDRRLRVGGDHQEGTGFEGAAAYVATDSLRHLVRKTLAATGACRIGGRPNEHHLA